MNLSGRAIENRLQYLESHLERENPVLLNAVQSFRQLDKLARRIGLLAVNESFATQIPWWPLISVLGTFSAGKSTFINNFLGLDLQRSGNQAVDDKFTVICYSREKTGHAIPGVALDSDPRFPFYQISHEIEQVAEGEGRRIDAYLQLKTCPSEQLRGKILIDSPGFDADAQRDSTLRITDHIIDLSDLVLVFFDARHPEPGAMRDTLEHLIDNTIHRADSGKFLYILNQIDTTAREDNPEEVIAAWERAMGEHGLTAGRFFSIYSPKAAVPIENENLRARFESKRDADLEEIHTRMREVEIERVYRIVATLEKTARDINDKVAPMLTEALSRWRRRVLWGDGVVFGLILAAFLFFTNKAGYWVGTDFQAPWWETLISGGTASLVGLALILVVIIGVHYLVRSAASRSVSASLKKEVPESDLRVNLAQAFRRNTRFWHSIFSRTPVGWGRGARKRLSSIIEDTDTYVQRLNDRFTNPSGEGASPQGTKVESTTETSQVTPAA
jgi:hypothetical protein